MRLSQNFYLAEADCHDGTPCPPLLIPNARMLANLVLQRVRDEWAAPLIVVSWYRTLDWNTRVGGAAQSTHLDATGADIRPVHLDDVKRLHGLVLAMHGRGAVTELGGLGEYPRWVHVDIKRAGRLRRWKGGGLGAEQ